jgi:hypothetical protein
LLAALAVVIFALRTYRSLLLLHSAYEWGAPDLSSVRPWMTLGYVAQTYSVPQAALAERLGHSPDVDPRTSLISLARRQGLSPFEHLRQVQEAISELRPLASLADPSGAVTEPKGFGDDILIALIFLHDRVLLFGYSRWP